MNNKTSINHLIRRINRRLYQHTVIKGLELRNAYRDNINPKSTIAIFANARGGSTWLGEVLNRAIPNSALVFEPLYVGKYKTDGKASSGGKPGIPARKLGFWYYQPIMKDEKWEEAESFFDKLFNQEILPLSVTFENQIDKIPKAKTYIYKFCYANLMMPWICDRYNLTPVFLLRHPGAVVSSQLNHPSWKAFTDNPNSPFNLPKFRNSNYFNQYEEILKGIRFPEENLAAMWAISVKRNIEYPEPDWLTIHYEDLVINPHHELKKIFDHLEVDIPEDLDRIAKIPSRTTIHNSGHTDEQLSKWQSHLSSIQIARIQEVLNRFEITLYNMDNILPMK